MCTDPLTNSRNVVPLSQRHSDLPCKVEYAETVTDLHSSSSKAEDKESSMCIPYKLITLIFGRHLVWRLLDS